MEKILFTSEAVTEGHPDKVCDQIADAVLDACLAQDPESRVACEVCTKTGFVMLFGEISTKAVVDYEKITRDTLKKIGYDNDDCGFNADKIDVIVRLEQQSADIARGVDCALENRQGMTEEDIEATGAGDQGMMFGYANDDTDALMPYPIYLAEQLALQLAKVRKDNTLPYLRPDGKTQVTVEYDDAGRPRRLEAVVISTQHDENVTQEQIHRDLKTYVCDRIIPAELVDADTRFYFNPTGRFVIGGPVGDSGLTGRKIIVDTYGGYARHGGGAFSGKDCTKVDRSASYAARYVAKNIVAAKLARSCEVQLAYAIGVASPMSVNVNTAGTGVIPDAQLTEIVRKLFDLRPAAIIRKLDLRRPIYAPTSCYGHFGRNELDLPWEQTDMVAQLQQAVK